MTTTQAKRMYAAIESLQEQFMLENEAARKITEIFNALRFDKETHLGEGKIALDAATQNKILEIISK